MQPKYEGGVDLALNHKDIPSAVVTSPILAEEAILM
jgi:hypothetical protein